MHVWRLPAYGVPLVVEGVACALVIRGDGVAGLGLHAAATALAFVLTLRWARGGSRTAAAFTAALLTATLPAVGLAILACVAWPSWHRALRPAEDDVVEVALPDGLADVDDAAMLGLVEPRPIRELLRDAPTAQERVRAVMALRNMDARKAVPLLRLAFSHESEDVRLLAFAILDRREKRLRSRIKVTESLLEGSTASPAEQARWHRRLARDHWELVYGGFVSGDLEPVVLGKAREHAHSVLETAADARMALLIARIYLREKDPEGAWDCLEHAAFAGAARANLVPLFAEAAFQLRRFDEIPGILRSAPPGELRRPELQPLAAFWTGRADA